MSHRKGADGPVPKHQNRTAFVHNPDSKKTAVIASIPATKNCCKRCADCIEWKRRYRKYKPLTKPGKCTGCSLSSIRLAYHMLCQACSTKENKCAKCGKVKSAADEDEEAIALAEIDEQIDTIEGTKGQIPGLPEREKRTMLRQLQREKEAIKKSIKIGAAGGSSSSSAAEGGGGGVGSAPEAADDEEEEEDDEEGDDNEEDEEDDSKDDEDAEDDEKGAEDTAAGAGNGSKNKTTQQQQQQSNSRNSSDVYEDALGDTSALFTKALADAKKKQIALMGGGQ